MTDVKLLRLTTGEDIVAEVTNQEYSDNDKTVTTIKKPFVLIPMAQNPSASQESKLYFSPFIPFAENEEFDIKEENIIYSLDLHLDSAPLVSIQKVSLL